MTMDVKKIAEEIVEKLKKDPSILQKFQAQPVQTLEGLLGIDLPEEQMEPVIAAVKAHLTAETAGAALSKLGGLFGKK